MLDRLKPRFSLRFLLVVMTAAAVLCYFLWPMTEGITEKQAQSIKLGMLPDEVYQALDGLPEKISAASSVPYWRYQVAAPVGCEPGELVVEFGRPSGTVTRIHRRGRSGFAFPW